jgi:hypothetical protein
MKKAKQAEELRSECTRPDFGAFVRGKYVERNEGEIERGGCRP